MLPPAVSSSLDDEPELLEQPFLFLGPKPFRLAVLFWNMEVLALDARETAGGPRVPEAQMFQKSSTMAFPKQKETLCVPLA